MPRKPQKSPVFKQSSSLNILCVSGTVLTQPLYLSRHLHPSALSPLPPQISLSWVVSLFPHPVSLPSLIFLRVFPPFFSFTSASPLYLSLDPSLLLVLSKNPCSHLICGFHVATPTMTKKKKNSKDLHVLGWLPSSLPLSFPMAPDRVMYLPASEQRGREENRQRVCFTLPWVGRLAPSAPYLTRTRLGYQYACVCIHHVRICIKKKKDNSHF